MVASFQLETMAYAYSPSLSTTIVFILGYLPGSISSVICLCDVFVFGPKAYTLNAYPGLGSASAGCVLYDMIKDQLCQMNMTVAL